MSAAIHPRRQAVKDSMAAFGLALGVHVLVGLFLLIGTWNWEPFRAQQVPVRVTLVDQAPRAADPAERQAREQELARQQAEEARRQQQLAEQREEQARAQREAEAQAERERQEEARREAERERRARELEAQRAAQAERERLAELQRQRDLERQRQEDERRREEEERLRELAELRAQREQAELERLEQERRLQELADRRAAEEAERAAEAEAERLRLADEQAQADARRATLREEYVATIRELVRRNWTRPPTTRPGVACRIRVVQIPGGEIIGAEIVSPCNADAATRRSITAAVQRVAFLPYQGYESVFAREIDFDFIYDG